MTLVLAIFALQIAYVSLLSVRFIFMVRGVMYWAAFISAIEIAIYVLGFKLVLDTLDKPLHLVAYCLGYAAGVLAGVKLEERIAVGYVAVQVVTHEAKTDFASALRSRGYGVTRWLGEGMEGRRWVHTVVTQRKKQSRLYRDVLELDPGAFLVSYEPKSFRGGFLSRSFRPGD